MTLSVRPLGLPTGGSRATAALLRSCAPALLRSCAPALVPHGLQACVLANIRGLNIAFLSGRYEEAQAQSGPKWAQTGFTSLEVELQGGLQSSLGHGDVLGQGQMP